MNESEKQLYREFCEFAKLQDNSDAEFPNTRLSLKLFMEGTDLDIKHWHWDPVEDCSLFSPECLVYVLLKARQFFEQQEKHTNS